MDIAVVVIPTLNIFTGFYGGTFCYWPFGKCYDVIATVCGQEVEFVNVKLVVRIGL
jgi:hypothetical protein